MGEKKRKNMKKPGAGSLKGLKHTQAASCIERKTFLIDTPRFSS